MRHRWKSTKTGDTGEHRSRGEDTQRHETGLRPDRSLPLNAQLPRRVKTNPGGWRWGEAGENKRRNRGLKRRQDRGQRLDGRLDGELDRRRRLDGELDMRRRLDGTGHGNRDENIDRDRNKHGDWDRNGETTRDRNRNKHRHRDQDRERQGHKKHRWVPRTGKSLCGSPRSQPGHSSGVKVRGPRCLPG
ncbi:negative elongation factor E-like [Astyanax mexicanus]|uniref:negative elongation factor E-like n=1 Tax=Astyanax mexicanus TaxID=7994 RepID=UPI0020CB1393|nr:negative elongation factor E-like [Astyanax mexicanus]